jgi:hypothetical protein
MVLIGAKYECGTLHAGTDDDAGAGWAGGVRARFGVMQATPCPQALAEFGAGLR